MPDITNEITFKTTRSGGKGGQNVNKVETAVLASFHVDQSKLFTSEQKNILNNKLANYINAEGFLQVKSQKYRTQFANKEEAIKKMNALIIKALQKKKSRIATHATKASVEKRIEIKKYHSKIKETRKKYRNDD